MNCSYAVYGGSGTSGATRCAGSKRSTAARSRLVPSAQRGDRLLPVGVGGLRHRRPVLGGSDLPAVAAKSPQHEVVARGEVQHDLPYGMRAGDRTRRRFDGSDAAQQLDDGGAVPRRSLERSAQLFLETGDLGRSAPASSASAMTTRSFGELEVGERSARAPATETAAAECASSSPARTRTPARSASARCTPCP